MTNEGKDVAAHTANTEGELQASRILSPELKKQRLKYIGL